MAFKSATGDKSRFKFEKEGQVLEGRYASMEEVEIDGDVAYRLNIETGEGVRAPLAPADLRRKMQEVPEGSLVRITFLGKIKLKGGKTLNKFEVEYDDSSAAPPTSTTKTTTDATRPRQL